MQNSLHPKLVSIENPAHTDWHYCASDANPNGFTSLED